MSAEEETTRLKEELAVVHAAYAELLLERDVFRRALRLIGARPPHGAAEDLGGAWARIAARSGLSLVSDPIERPAPCLPAIHLSLPELDAMRAIVNTACAWYIARRVYMTSCDRDDSDVLGDDLIHATEALVRAVAHYDELDEE